MAKLRAQVPAARGRAPTRNTTLRPAIRRRLGRLLRNRVRRNRSRNVDSALEDSFRGLQIHGKGGGADEDRACWSSLPVDIQDLILTKLPYTHLYQAKAASKLFNDRINSDGFHHFRGLMHPQEGFLTALHFFVHQDHGQVWQCAGYDLISKSWRILPPFHMLARLNPDSFKDFSICGARGIMCVNVSTSSSMHRKMIVFNPLTGRRKELPSLHYPRTPVLMHMVVDSAGDSYKIIVAVSAGASHSDHLSKITEVFDSRTEIWTVTDDLPGPLIALNDHQTGVHINGILYCISFLEGVESGKLGVLAFSVNRGTWLPHLSCPLPNSTNLNIVQLVDSNGEVVVFSEIEDYHRIDLLEEVVMCTNLRATNLAQGTGKWRNVVLEKKVGSRGLLVYPEYTCVPFEEGKLCIFNTILRTGVVYDVQSGNRIEILSSPIRSSSEEMRFFSLNPLTFNFEPSFKGKP